MCMAVPRRGHERSQGSRCFSSTSAKRLALDGASSARATLRPAHEQLRSSRHPAQPCYSYLMSEHIQDERISTIEAYKAMFLFMWPY